MDTTRRAGALGDPGSRDDDRGPAPKTGRRAPWVAASAVFFLASAALGVLFLREASAAADGRTHANDLSQRLTEARGALEVQGTRAEECTANLSAREKALADATSNVAARDRTIVDLQSALATAGKTEESLRADLAARDQTIADLVSKAAAGAASEASLRAELGDRDSKLADLRRQIDEGQKALVDTRQQSEAQDRARADRLEVLQRQSEAEVREAKDRISRLENDVQAAQADVAKLRENNTLTLVNDGNRAFLEWALIVYRDGSGNLAVREMSFKENNNGWWMDPGGTVSLGTGIVAVLFVKEDGGDTARYQHWWVSRPPGSGGTIHVTTPW